MTKYIILIVFCILNGLFLSELFPNHTWLAALLAAIVGAVVGFNLKRICRKLGIKD